MIAYFQIMIIPLAIVHCPNQALLIYYILLLYIKKGQTNQSVPVALC